MTSDLVGASVWEQELYDYLRRHVQKEEEILEEYRREAETSESKAFRYLVGLILEEERRHHERFVELAESLRASVTWESEPPVPRLAQWGPLPERVVEATEHLLAEERADARELRQLEQRLKIVKDTTLWQLLVRLMEADTDKHITVLQFVREHARHPERF
jgi:rubrerythrin